MEPCDENVYSNRVPGLHNPTRHVGKDPNAENLVPGRPPRMRRPLGEISGNSNPINIPSDRHNVFKPRTQPIDQMNQENQVAFVSRLRRLQPSMVPPKKPQTTPWVDGLGLNSFAPMPSTLPEPKFVIFQDNSSTEQSASENTIDVSLEQHQQSSQDSGFVPPPVGVAARVAASVTSGEYSFSRDSLGLSVYAPNVSEFGQNVSISSVSSDDGGENDLSCDTNPESSGRKDVQNSTGSTRDVDEALEGELLLNDRKNEPEWVLNVAEYEHDILVHARQSELRYLPKWNYMTKQSDITFAMRSILVDWLVEVGEEYQMGTETIYLAVNYIDRFLSFMSVQRAKLQLVGTSSIFIASKYEEIYPPDLGQFVYITDDTYSRKQILKMEQLILGVLGFSVTVPTAYYFVNHYSKLAGSTEKTLHLSRFLAELTLVDGETYLPFLPSVIAASAVALARHTLGFAAWDTDMEEKTGYNVEDFKNCLVSLHETFKKCKQCPQQAVVDKYKHEKHYCVSKTVPTPIFWVESA